MTIRVNFSSASDRDAFADKFKVTAPAGVDHLDVPWHFLHQVKNDASVTNFEPYDTDTAHEFIVKGDPDVISQYGEVKQNLGMGFFIVASNNVTELAKNVESIEITSISAGFLGSVSNIMELNAETTTLDPTSAEAQWPRIRVASRYRPLLTSYTLHDVNFLSEPELIIMDTGVNASCPELQYDGITVENFYALPVFNNDFTDLVGHGTAVASMAVGKNLGVARKCKVVSVKIGDDTRSASIYELGVAIDAIVSRVAADPLKTRILNMSWGVPRSAWLDAKIQGLIDAGVTVVCAAGNSGISVEDISPAGLDTVITVGAIDKYDIPAGYNNISPSDSGLVSSHGLSLDIFAPGDGVVIPLNGAYKLASGTSFASPLVAGIAVEIAALNQNIVPYNTMKDLIINTATEHALLFEDDRFSENQNRVAYIYTSDPLSVYKNADMVSYLSIHNPEEKASIVGDLNSNLALDAYKIIHPEDTITYSLEWYDPQVEADYSPFVHIDPNTGVFEIEYPTVPLPDEVRLKMVEFKGVATTSRIRMETNKMFFFAANPNYRETLTSDVTLALSEINSVAFFGLWSGVTLK